MQENMPLDDNTQPGASWPQVPTHIDVVMELKCRKCGYKIRWTSPKDGGSPSNFREMSEHYLKNHLHADGCKH